MTSTKNPQPTSTYSDSSRDSSFKIPNFILVGPPQPICEAKPLKSRPAKMKHVAPRRSSRNVWNSAAKNKSGTDPNAPIDLEKEEEIPSQATNQDVASEKDTEQPFISEKGAEPPHSSSRTVKTEKKVKEKHEKSDEKEESVKGKQSQGVKRKQPDMHYWNKKAIVSVTDYSIDEIEKNGWKISPYLSYQKWEHFINLDQLVYRERVREFYANARFSLQPLQITSYLDGREFTISPYTIGRTLNLPTYGTEIFEENWYNALGISAKELRTILLKDPSENICAPNLKPMVKLLHHISSRNLLPRAGTFEKVTTGDCIILYHLISRKPVSLPFLMIHHMINAIKADKLQTSLPYGKALIVIFHHHLFNFPRKEG